MQTAVIVLLRKLNDGYKIMSSNKLSNILNALKRGVSGVARNVSKNVGSAARNVKNNIENIGNNIGNDIGNNIGNNIGLGKNKSNKTNSKDNKTYKSDKTSKSDKTNKKPRKSAFSKYIGVRSIFNPVWCLYGLRLSIAVLSVFGVFMVISSSSVTLISNNLSPWAQGLMQGRFCIIGFVAYIVLACMPPNFYKKKVGVIYIVAVVMQALTWMPGLRHEVNGNAGWIKIGPITLQPAEITKLALCIWLPMVLIAAAKRYKHIGFKAYWPVLSSLAVPLLLIVAGKDLGTALIVIFIAFISFFIGGFPIKGLLTITLLAALGVLLMVVTSQNRMRRIFATLYGCDAKDIRGVCFQSIHAQYAMASGGFLGVGIGNSREKWNYLPYAHNDFIFAIIGEEMGFLGASIVIALYVVIGWCLIVSAIKSRSRFISMVLVCIAAWIVGQGLVNILVVVQLLPVMGVPMPFVSAGGSSLVMCLAAAGVADALIRANLRTLISDSSVDGTFSTHAFSSIADGPNADGLNADGLNADGLNADGLNKKGLH